MKITSLEQVLCVVLMMMLAGESISGAQEPVTAGTTEQTLFAYNSSIHRPHLQNDPYGYSLIPSYVPLELTPVDPVAWAHATVGSTVSLRVVHYVIVGHSGYAQAGALIEAKVTRMREGALRVRRGKLEPRVREVSVEGALEMTLESSPRSHFSRTAKHIVTFPVTVARVLVIDVPEYILLFILLPFCRTDCDL